MLKNRHKNSYVTQAPRKGYKKVTRNLVMTLAVMIFIFGASLAVYRKKHQPKVSGQSISIDSEIPGWWYQKYFGKSICDNDTCKPETDTDSDKLTNSQEYFYHTDPKKSHTVGDKMSDGELVAAGFDPSKPGHMTFDQVVQPENLLGESLVFSDDIRKLVAESNDINNVVLPAIKDDELKIVYGESEENYKAYSSKLNSTISKYFYGDSLEETLKSGSDSQVEEIGAKARILAKELKDIPVPVKFTSFHKYNIVLFQLLSEIVPAPAVASDIWFDKARQFLAVSQKLDFEKNKLNIAQ